MIKNSVGKTAFKVWLRLLFASVLCFIVWVSINAMSTGFFSDVIGYRIYETDENGESVQISEHIYAADEDTNADIPLNEGQEILYLRETSAKTDAITGVISNIFTALIFCLFPYNILWNMGTRDENYVHVGKMQKDALFGLKVGLTVTIPSTVLYCLLILGKCGVFPSVIIKWHRLLNPAFIPFIDAVERGAQSATQLTVGSLLGVGAVLLVVPAICTVGYTLGYKQISLYDKLLYSKNSKK